MQQTEVILRNADAVEEGAPLTVLPSPTPEQLANLPEIRRGAVDAQGRATYTVRMAGDVTQGNITVTDPTGRVEQQAF